MENEERKRESSTKKLQRNQISRRDFLKLAGLTVGSGAVLAGEAAGLGVLAGSNRSGDIPAKDLSVQESIYGRKGSEYIKEIETRLNLILPLPGAIQMPGEYNEKYGRTDITPGNNVAWQKEELALLAILTKKLPKGYGSGLAVASLAKYPIDNDHYGGSWTNPYVSIFTPKLWNPNTPPIAPGIWNSISDEFQGAVIHELTHRMTEGKPGLLDKYAREMGWKKEQDKWVLEDGLGVVEKLWIYRTGSYEAHRSPNEDIAIAVSIFLINPQAFSYESRPDRARYDFLSKNL